MSNDEVKYSLWLRPEQSQLDDYTQIISELAHRNQTKVFPPHITLIAGISKPLELIESACESITSKSVVFEISFTEICYTEEFYKAFFIDAVLSEKLNTLYSQSVELLQLNHQQYLPHLSLLYGNISEAKKEKLKMECDNKYPNPLTCSRLDIYNTTGEIPSWYLINSYPFN